MSDSKNIQPPIYASCPYEGTILDYYDGQFESVYILLSPFIKPVHIEPERFYTAPYPTKEELLTSCEPISWEDVLKLTELNSISEIDIGLRSSIGGLKAEYENKDCADALSKLSIQNKIILPTEGEISPFLENKLYEAIKSLGYKDLWVCDEFGDDKISYNIDELMKGNLVPINGSVYTDKHDILITSHWDSHCSFLCTSEDILKTILGKHTFEGFFCSNKTQVYWGLYDIS